MKEQIRIGIIGAGASGMMAAITAAKNAAEVTLFEKNSRVGKKILATGNGKCNLGNLNFSTKQYYCKDEDKLERLFHIFPTYDMISFFENIGLHIKNKNGYLYPYCEQASAVLDVLRMELERCGVKVVTDTEIVSAACSRKDGSFQLTDEKGNRFCFDRIILSCGSPASLKQGEGMRGYELAKSFGHTITPILPGLVQLKSKESFTKALAGVRCEAGIKLMIDGKEAACETGELQFTAYGISGIPVFQISRMAAYALREQRPVTVLIDFFPEWEKEIFAGISRLRYEAQWDKTMEDYLTGMLNKKINMVMMKQEGIQPKRSARQTGWPKIWSLMQKYRAFPIAITQVNTMENAQVCAGGIDFGQVGLSLESELVKGLYLTGEMLDIDGKCGGYNLQWAWTSGYVAGLYAAGQTAPDFKETDREEIHAENKPVKAAH